MEQNKQIKKQLKIINGQLLGCLLYIVALIIAVIIVVNVRKQYLSQDRILTNEEIQRLSLVNKIFIFLLVLFFLYLSYEGYELTKELNQDTTDQTLQVFAAFLSVIAAFIGLYIVWKSISQNKITLSEVENLFS